MAVWLGAGAVAVGGTVDFSRTRDRLAVGKSGGAPGDSRRPAWRGVSAHGSQPGLLPCGFVIAASAWPFAARWPDVVGFSRCHSRRVAVDLELILVCLLGRAAGGLGGCTDERSEGMPTGLAFVFFAGSAAWGGANLCVQSALAWLVLWRQRGGDGGAWVAVLRAWLGGDALGQALGGCRSPKRHRPLRRVGVAALATPVFAAGRLGHGGSLVRGLSAMPVGHGDGGADRAARWRDAGAAGVQPAALWSPLAGECALPHPAAARCAAAMQ